MGDTRPDLENQVKELRAAQRLIQEQLGALSRQRPAVLTAPKEIRWAVTTTEASYPITQANAFPIRFLDSHFTATMGLQTATHTPRSTLKTAVALSHRDYIPAGVPLPVFWDRGLGAADKGDWWFLDPPPRYFGRLISAVTHGATANVAVWLYDLTTGWYETTIVLPARGFMKAGKTIPINSLVAIDWYFNQWVVSEFGGDGIQRFRLTATLSCGGSAAAVIRTFDGANYNNGGVIYVFDWYSLTAQAPGVGRGMWEGVSGMEGFCFRREIPSVVGQEQYDILWMEQYARWIGFTLTEAMSATISLQASATVNSSFFQGDAPTSPLIVHDDQNLFPRALTGARGWAVRSEYEGSQAYYKVVTCQQMVQRGTAILTADMCGGNPAFNTFVGTTFSTFNQQPAALPTTGKNPRGHYAISGSPIGLEWNEATGFWEVYDVSLVPISVVVSFYCANGSIGYRSVTVMVERCSLVQSSTNPIANCTTVACTDTCPPSSGSGSGVGSGIASGSGDFGGCCATPPNTVYLNLTASPACTEPGCFTSAISMALVKNGDTWQGSYFAPCGLITAGMQCITGVGYEVSITCGGGTKTIRMTTNTCSPFRLTGSFSDNVWACCRAGGATITFTLEVTQ